MKKFVVFWIIVLMLTGSLVGQVQERQPYFGIHGGMINLLGGEKPNEWKSWAGGQIGFYFTKRIGLELAGGYGWSRPDYSTDDEKYITYLYPVSLSLKYNFKEDARFTPYGMLGAGLLRWDLRDIEDNTENYSFGDTLGDRVYDEEMKDTFIVLGFGAHYFLSKYFSLEGGIRFNYIVEHGTDMNGFGGKQYGIAEARLGFNIHFQKNKDWDKDGLLNPVETNTGIYINPEDTGSNPKIYDTDKDGFNDFDEVNLHNTDPNKTDTDGDGISDYEEINKYATDPLKPDSDEDGLNDYDEIFVHSTDPLDADSDNDKIIDGKDKCPLQPENYNGYQDSDGCPDEKPVKVEKPVEVKKEVIKEKPLKFENITFRTGSDYLTLESKAILDKVVKLLNENPQMKLEINGYTDSTGPRQVNIDLSRYRAIAVKKYLVSKGIAGYRLTTNGYGPDNPVASNYTDEGRAKNRRIEFVPVK